MRRLRHSPQTQCFLALTFFLGIALSPQVHSEVIPDAQESHPGLGMESRFSEAVIAYNKRQTGKALKILDELIHIAPTNREYLEMKALALKGSGNTEQSYAVYKSLYEVTPDKDRGPYAFELGTILFGQNKPNEAKPYFEKAAELNFNVVASRFYLGLGAYQQTQFSEAANHFQVAAESSIEPFSVMGKYYLGISYFKLNNGPQGVQQLVEVRKQTQDAKEGDLTKTIADGTEKMLAPFAHDQWFGNMLLQSQYDSNVQQLPSGVSNPTAGGTNPATMKMNFSGGGGYMSAPINTFQWVAGYRASYNYNLNRETKGYEYFTNNASLYLNYNTLARTSAGLKLESSFAFQNSLTDPTASLTDYQYQKYNFTVGGGPYFRHQLNREWKMEAEAGIRTQKFFADPNLSGKDYNARLTFRSDLGRAYFNPAISGLFENNRTDGDQFFYSSYGLSLNNSISLPGSVTFNQSLDVLFTNYSRAVPSRNDQNYTLRFSGSKQLNPKLSLLADIGYIKNTSTIVDVYSYNQFIGSFGAGYSF